MGNSQSNTPPSPPQVEKSPVPVDDFPRDAQGKKLKPCCVCPETKELRDKCIVEKGEENCRELIETHKACMRQLGFKV